MPAHLCFPGHRLQKCCWLPRRMCLKATAISLHFPLSSLYSHTTVREGRGQPHFSPCACFSAKSKKGFTCAPFYHSTSASFCIRLEMVRHDTSVCKRDQAGVMMAENCLSLHKEEEMPGEKDFI